MDTTVNPLANRDAECGVLGAALSSSRSAEIVLGSLSAEDFYYPDTLHVFESIKKIISERADGSSGHLDLVTVIAAVESFPDGRNVKDFLQQLMLQAPPEHGLHDYMMLVSEKTAKRVLVGLGEDLHPGRIAEQTPENIVSHVGQTLGSLKLPSSLAVRTVDTLADSIMERYYASEEEYARIAAVSTGFPEVDNLLGGGLVPGRLYIVAARPGMGKTSLGAQIMLEYCYLSDRLGYLATMEMSGEEMMTRMVSTRSLIPTDDITNRKISEDKLSEFNEAVNEIRNQPLVIEERPHQTLSTLRAGIITRAAAAGKMPGLLVIDYIQLLKGEGRYNNRENEVASLSKGLKQMARELNIPILALAQLSRDLEKRADKRPILADLRESGALEQDADVVMFVYRNSVYEKEDHENLAEVIIAKNRHGSSGVVSIGWFGEYTRFVSLSSEEEEFHLPTAPDPDDEF